MAGIDPVAFGELVATVAHLRDSVERLQKSNAELVALANKGRGAFFAGVALSGIAGSFIGWFTHKQGVMSAFFSGLTK